MQQPAPLHRRRDRLQRSRRAALAWLVASSVGGTTVVATATTVLAGGLTITGGPVGATTVRVEAGQQDSAAAEFVLRRPDRTASSSAEPFKSLPSVQPELRLHPPRSVSVAGPRRRVVVRPSVSPSTIPTAVSPTTIVKRPAFAPAAPRPRRLSDLVDLTPAPTFADPGIAVGHRQSFDLPIDLLDDEPGESAMPAVGLNQPSVDPPRLDPPAIVASEISKLEIAELEIPEPVIAESVIAESVIGEPVIAEPEVSDSAIAALVVEVAEDVDDRGAGAETAAPKVVRPPLIVHRRRPAAPIDVQPVQKPTQSLQPAPLEDRRIAATNRSAVDDRQAVSPAVRAAADRLRTMARRSMVRGKELFDRGAVYSAREAVMTSLRQLVQSTDLTRGGNTATATLTAAMRAIAEAEDFTSIYGVDDTAAMRRMVASHQTDVLSTYDLERLPSFAATEMYLQFATESLRTALSACRESGDALILLGRIEQSLAPEDTAYHGAVALAMHRAAAEIRPDSAFIRRELGVTMADQGMNRQAAESLRRSVSMRPTRRGYRHLQLVSAKLGDHDTADQCRTAMLHEDLNGQSTVRQLAPVQFAATGPPPPVQKSAAKPDAPVASGATDGSPKNERSAASRLRQWFQR